MSISFHCENCKKKIKTPDTTGGKWGKCPYCNHRCYIPLPPDPDGEELMLAPIDLNEEDQHEDMARDTFSLTENILREMESPDDESTGSQPINDFDKRELLKRIILYLQQMAYGELDKAEETAAKIRLFKNEAKDILQRMVKAERPEPELAEISPKVLQGLIKNLYSSL